MYIQLGYIGIYSWRGHGEKIFYRTKNVPKIDQYNHKSVSFRGQRKSSEQAEINLRTVRHLTKTDKGHNQYNTDKNYEQCK